MTDLRERLTSGWVYRDIPRMSPDYWAWFLKTIGEGNFEMLSEAEYFRGDPKRWAKRGQLLISPDGIANLKAVIGRVLDLFTAIGGLRCD